MPHAICPSVCAKTRAATLRWAKATQAITARLEAQRIVDVSPAGEVRERAQSIITLALGLYNSGRTLVRRLRPEVDP